MIIMSMSMMLLSLTMMMKPDRVSLRSRTIVASWPTCYLITNIETVIPMMMMMMIMMMMMTAMENMMEEL